MSKNLKELINYWFLSAEHDYQTMLGLFKIKRYSDCLFYGHIVLEKILKALAVQYTKKPARYTHNLLILIKDANLTLSEEQLESLDAVSRFNIRARYPDKKLKFYKICTKEYTEDYFKRIKKLYKFLCQKLKERK